MRRRHDPPSAICSGMLFARVLYALAFLQHLVRSLFVLLVLYAWSRKEHSHSRAPADVLSKRRNALMQRNNVRMDPWQRSSQPSSKYLHVASGSMTNSFCEWACTHKNVFLCVPFHLFHSFFWLLRCPHIVSEYASKFIYIRSPKRIVFRAISLSPSLAPLLFMHLHGWSVRNVEIKRNVTRGATLHVEQTHEGSETIESLSQNQGVTWRRKYLRGLNFHLMFGKFRSCVFLFCRGKKLYEFRQCRR